MALIILLQSFDSFGIQNALLGISNEDEQSTRVYKGFESDWYSRWGKKIGYLILVASFSSNFFDLCSFLWVFILRFKDRKY